MGDIEIVRAAARTSTGTQDFTFTGFGTPKGAIFLVSYGTADGTQVSHAMCGFGATDGTRNRAIACRFEDAVVASSDTGNGESDASCLITVLNSTNTQDGAAAFDSWITDGVRINWTDAPPSGYMVTCILFGGSGISDFYTNHYAGTGVLNTAVDVTAPGFQPDLVLFFSAINPFNNTASSNGRPAIGFCVRDGASPPTQRCMTFGYSTTTSPQACLLVADTNCVARNGTGGASTAEIECNDFDSSGFSLYSRVSITTVIEGYYVAVKLNGLSAKLQTIATPTSTGSNSVTGVGFTPQFVMTALGSALAVDTVYSDANSECYGVGVATATVSGCISQHVDDGATDSNTECMTDSKLIRMRKDGSDFLTATLTAFTSDGMTLNYTTVDASARQQFGLFIQAGTGATSRLLSGKLIGKLGRD